MSKANKGQLLIESMIAISVVTVALLGILALLSQSLALRRVVSDRYVATYLATEGVEIIKNMIDTSYIEKTSGGQTANEAWRDLLFNADPGPYVVSVEGDKGEVVVSKLVGLEKNLRYNSLNGNYGYQAGDDTIFKRKVVVQPVSSSPGLSSDELRVNSIVTWEARGGAFSINLEDHFFNWR